MFRRPDSAAARARPSSAPWCTRLLSRPTGSVPVPVATISTIFCVQQATGVDSVADQAFADFLAGLSEVLLPGELGDQPIEAIRSLPGVLAAIDAARSDPDNLYVTAVPNAGRENAIWPPPDVEVEMQAGQSVAPDIRIEFDASQNISRFDEDPGIISSDDDLLGSITIFASEQGQGLTARLAASRVEQSVYYIFYRVD